MIKDVPANITEPGVRDTLQTVAYVAPKCTAKHRLGF